MACVTITPTVHMSFLLVCVHLLTKKCLADPFELALVVACLPDQIFNEEGLFEILMCFDLHKKV